MRDKTSKETGEGQAKEAELLQPIVGLQMELELLKQGHRSSEAPELCKLVDHAHPELCLNRQSVLLGLVSQGLGRSDLSSAALRAKE